MSDKEKDEQEAALAVDPGTAQLLRMLDYPPVRRKIAQIVREQMELRAAHRPSY